MRRTGPAGSERGQQHVGLFGGERVPVALGLAEALLLAVRRGETVWVCPSVAVVGCR